MIWEVFSHIVNRALSTKETQSLRGYINTVFYVEENSLTFCEWGSFEKEANMLWANSWIYRVSWVELSRFLCIGFFFKRDLTCWVVIWIHRVKWGVFSLSPITPTHCNTLQHTATHCNNLQHTATLCNTLQHIWIYRVSWGVFSPSPITATHCNTLQHTAHTHMNTSRQLGCVLTEPYHCDTLRHTATHCTCIYEYFMCWGVFSPVAVPL